MDATDVAVCGGNGTDCVACSIQKLLIRIYPFQLPQRVLVPRLRLILRAVLQSQRFRSLSVVSPVEEYQVWWS